ELCKEFENQVRSGRLFCTRESDPIRGPDGKIHGNKCALCADILNAVVNSGIVQRTEHFTVPEKTTLFKVWMAKHMATCVPCAKLSCEYGVLSEAEAEEKKKAEAETRNRRGSEDSDTYAKLCDGYRKVRKNGILYCTRENDPIRGPDGKVHGNTCSMCQAFFIQEDKARAKVRREAAKELCSKYRPQVRNGRLPCPRKNDPTEGLDGKIHENTCSMCEAF
ncbi:hypothetical protein A6R68_24259, partial [Neotoma lepida]